MNTDQDYVHLQLEVAPNMTISDAVSYLKSHSSLHLRKKFKFIKSLYGGRDDIWSVGYFVSSVGLNEQMVKKYIEWQGRKETPQTTRLF